MNEDTDSDRSPPEDQTLPPDDGPVPARPAPARRTRWPWLFPLLLVVLLLAIVGQNLLRPDNGQQGTDATGPPTEQFVSLVIDFGDQSVKQFSQVPWHEGMTVLDALHWAKQQQPGIDFEYEDKGGQAFVDSIDGHRNQGVGPASKNWLYEVNKNKGQQSCGIRTVEPADAILWEFTLYD